MVGKGAQREGRRGPGRCGGVVWISRIVSYLHFDSVLVFEPHWSRCGVGELTQVNSDPYPVG